MANAEPVASEPRLFVGQVPTDKTAEDLIPLFEGFGVIKNLHLVKGPDGKSRGCAMVLFDRWTSAEAAMEKHDGKTVLDGGKGRALVVHFANPRKAGPTGMAPEQGVAPKKIFVGQVVPSWLHIGSLITQRQIRSASQLKLLLFMGIAVNMMWGRIWYAWRITSQIDPVC